MALFVLKPFKEGIGTRAFDVMKVYQEGENRLFYIDQAAKISAQETAYDFALNGGFELISKCGAYDRGGGDGAVDRYNFWTGQGTLECYPEDYKETFTKMFNQELKRYISLMSSEEFVEISGKSSIYAYSLAPDINYELAFFNNAVIGTANIPMQINLYRGKEGLASPIIGSYKINPNFNVNIGYDINEYKELIEQAKTLINDCKAQTDLKGCAENKIQDFELKWHLIPSITAPDRTLLFNVESSKLFLLDRTLVYKFALYFPV
jgi:hypothetical protein